MTGTHGKLSLNWGSTHPQKPKDPVALTPGDCQYYVDPVCKGVSLAPFTAFSLLLVVALPWTSAASTVLHPMWMACNWYLKVVARAA